MRFPFRAARIAAFILLAGAMNAPAAPRLPQAVDTQRTEAAQPVASGASAVILLRGGVGGIFSHGLDAIGQRLRAGGIPATVAGYGGRRGIVRALIERRRKGGAGRVVLVGHSFGADAATAIAADLAKAGIKVDLLVSLAATSPAPVAPNVRRAVNYYFARGGWGRPLVAARGFRGRLDNRDYSRVAGVGHFNIEEQAAIQAEVVAAVRSAIGR